jgi:hypothetical protein
MTKPSREVLMSFKRERKLAEREISLLRQAERECKRTAWTVVEPLKRRAS